MRRLFAIIVAAIALVGCSKDNITESYQNDQNDIYYASFEEFGDKSRTYLDEDVKLLWHEDDRISLFRTTLNEQFKFTGATGDNSGGFAAVPSDEWVTGNQVSTNYAVYPYDATTRLSNAEIIQLTMPAVQYYAENSFGRGANTMVAAAENISSKFLPFRNLGGYIIVKLYGEDTTIKSIEFKGNNDEIIAGAASAEAKYGYLPVVSMSESGTTTITLDCGEEGVTISSDSANPTSFWFVVPPITFEGGFTFTITDINGNTFTKSTTKSQTVVRNEIKSMAALAPNFEGTTEDPEEPKPANNEIWYTNGSTTEATTPYATDVFGANIVSNTYDAEKECWVITFDSDVTSVGGVAFYNCNTLTSANLPESVTTLGPNAFSGCTSMQNLILPHSITKIGSTYNACAFRNCTGKLVINCNIHDSYYDTSEDEYNIFYEAKFTEIVVGDSVTTLGNNAFRTCSSLESLTLGSGITTYGANLLFGCTNLSKIYGPNASADNRCWIPNGTLMLFAPGGATEYTILDGVTNIGQYAFRNCTALTSVTIPNSVIGIAAYAFYNCSSLQSIYVKATVPPTLVTSAFNANAANRQIYIPYTSAEAYDNASGWKDYTLTPYDYDNNKVYEHPQNPITYDWYTKATDGVYEIDAPEELVALSKLTNGDKEALATVGAEAALTFEGATINLMADIDLSDYCSPLVGSWTPIGTFKGVFNGNNHTISNLYCKTTGSTGLFLYLSAATIKDLTVQGEITSSSAVQVGGFTASAISTTFENCISDVNVTTSTDSSGTRVGGICGISEKSKYIACQATGDIIDTIDEWEWENNVGGLVGRTSGGDLFIACMKPSGKVYEMKSQSYSPVGGILGFVGYTGTYATIHSCYTSISVMGRAPGYITNSGYAEKDDADIANCYYVQSDSKVKGIGTRSYGSYMVYDSGTTASSDIAAEIVIMNEGIDTWNTAHPDCVCNYKYELDANGNPTLVKQTQE